MRKLCFMALGLLAVGGTAGWIAARSLEKPDGAKGKEKAAVTAAEEREGPLETLDWLVGDWVDTSDERTVELSCHFAKNKAFLIRSFRIVTKKGVGMSGMQVIAWDPARETIRSWTYDSDGGFGEETWKQSGNRYTIRAKYTLPDGGLASAVHVLNYVNDDKFTWKSVNREIGGELQPDVDEAVIVRKPAAVDK
jgi:hypothetical protein